MSSEVIIATLIGIGIGMGVLALSLLVPRLVKHGRAARATKKTAARLESGIQVSDLAIDPVEAKQGERVTISFRISNVSETHAVVRRVVKVNGAEVRAVDLELAPGESQVASLAVAEDAPGEYKVEVGDLTGSFVISPARLHVSAMDISPREVKEGGQVDIAAEVSNGGGTVGVDRLEVILRGKILLSQEVSVAPGQSEKVNATLTDLQPGIYEVKIGDFKDTFTVWMSDTFETI